MLHPWLIKASCVAQVVGVVCLLEVKSAKNAQQESMPGQAKIAAQPASLGSLSVGMATHPRKQSSMMKASVDLDLLRGIQKGSACQHRMSGRLPSMPLVSSEWLCVYQGSPRALACSH